MAVNIDELQVETQPAAPSGQAQGSSPGAGNTPKPDIKAEMDRLRERELRLRAD
ncbi:MAG: hypothetical protein ACLP59_10055 [Bryobacteraceae bacterium]